MDQLYIKKHVFVDHAGFKGKHIVNFKPQKTNLILGINGSGKSSLLNSIYGNVLKGLSGLVSSESKLVDISKSTIHYGMSFSESLSTFEVNNSGAISNYEVGLKMNINDRTHGIGSGVANFTRLLTNFFHNNNSLPVFRYFKSEKLIDDTKTIVSNQSFNKIENRTVGYNSHSSDFISIQEVTSFFINLINNENQEKVEKRNFNFETEKGRYLRETINTFAKILYGSDLELSVKASKYSNGQSLVIKKEEGELEFIQLSSGEKYVIALVLELIYRNITLNPNSTNLVNTPGIILIDEIEDHLHPRWQLNILKALNESFPNFQFIIASHSPLIASSVRKDQIIALSNFEIIPSEELSDIYSGTSDELLNKILFSDNQINDYKDIRKELDVLIAKFDFNHADKLLAELKARVQARPKWLIDYERKISFGKL